MNLQKKIHVWKVDFDKSIVEELVNENLKNKLNNYLSRFDKKNAEWTIELSVDKNKKSLFDWKLMINLDWNAFRYEREDYKNLDDLINHLFDRFKEWLSSKQKVKN